MMTNFPIAFEVFKKRLIFHILPIQIIIPTNFQRIVKNELYVLSDILFSINYTKK